MLWCQTVFLTPVMYYWLYFHLPTYTELCHSPLKPSKFLSFFFLLTIIRAISWAHRQENGAFIHACHSSQNHSVALKWLRVTRKSGREMFCTGRINGGSAGHLCVLEDQLGNEMSRLGSCCAPAKNLPPPLGYCLIDAAIKCEADTKDLLLELDFPVVLSWDHAVSLSLNFSLKWNKIK